MTYATIVGERNPYGADSEYALYPAPEGSAGHRLCCQILGMRRKDYLNSFDRVNLLAREVWCLWTAMMAAAEVRGDRLILLGRLVCEAFGLAYRPLSLSTYGATRAALILPHPSGRCRMWDTDGTIERARELVRKFVPEVADLIGVIG